LKEKPFENVIQNKFFFQGESFSEAVDRLLYVIHEHDFCIGLLSGAIGSGKTTIKQHVKHKLFKNEFEIAEVEGAAYGFLSMLQEIVDQIAFNTIIENFDLLEKTTAGSDSYLLMKKFKQILQGLEAQEGRRLVVFIDEAQQISAESLRGIRNLTNLNNAEKKYVTFILMGQPELKQIVQQVPEFDDRVALKYNLNFLEKREIPFYLQHRLTTAGYQGQELFLQDCTEFLYEQTRGSPRKINLLCKLALEYAIALQVQSIDQTLLQAVVQDRKDQET